MSGQTINLPPEQAKHATRVLRLATGDRVQLLDGAGRCAVGKLVVDDQTTRCVIESLQTLDRPSPLIELATAIPKGPRGDTMVNDLAQLGVDTLIPLTTQHSIVDPGPNKIERYRKAAIAASKQSLRAWLMQVDEKSAFDQVLACDAGLKLIADPQGKPVTSLGTDLASADTVRVLIGPEGGWHEGELAAAEQAGFIRWCYSPNVLRVETAAAAAVAILRSGA